MRAHGKFTLLLFVATILVYPSVHAKPKQSVQSAATDGVELFQKGTDAWDISWDDDELTKIRQLHTGDLDDKEKFLASPNLARYLGLSPIEALHMSIPLSFVFIGFAGEGNMQVNFTQDELQGWFQHLDHILPHQRVALSEITCVEDGHCAGEVHGQLRPSPLANYVHLNFSCQVVGVKRHDVVHTLERALFAFSRPLHPDVETGDQQVDAVRLEYFINDLIESLELSNTYVVLVINPPQSPGRPIYGYRQGFSQEEVELLQTHRQKLINLLGHKLEQEPTLTSAAASWNQWGHHKQGEKFGIRDLRWNSEQWVKSASEFLKSEEEYKRRVLRRMEDFPGNAAVARALRLLQFHPDRDITSILMKELDIDHKNPGGQPSASSHHGSFRVASPLEDCLTSNWVSRQRWLLVDLTAGPFTWGPAHGGDGVVHEGSLPSVQKRFGAVAEKRFKVVEGKGSLPGEDQLRDAISEKSTQRLADLAQKQTHLKSMAAQRAAAPGSLSGDALAAQQEKAFQNRLLIAQLEVYEEFALIHCDKRSQVPLVCLELKEGVEQLRHELSATSATTAQPMTLHRGHMWDIFGNDEDLGIDDDTYLGEMVRAHDLFMAELAAVLSRGLRHVVAPPTATWHHDRYLHDTASPWAKQVHFMIYQISDTARGSSHVSHSFDLDHFKAAVRSLALSNQDFSFTVHSLNLLDDPVLATSFASSLRSSMDEVPHEDGLVGSHEVVYINSAELGYRLRQHMPAIANKGQMGDPHAHLEVPVFVFQLERDVPILIDVHYNAKALEDMVLVVQNAHHQDEVPTGMMCQGVLISRPLSPMKGALAAVLQHLGGLLPSHLGYNPARDVVTHDWLWSVGAHALSSTSPSISYSQLQVDALHRSYVLDGIDGSVDMINQGIRLLMREQSLQSTFNHLQERQVRSQVHEILGLYSHMVVMWTGVVNNAQMLKFAECVELIPRMEKQSRHFLELCEELSRSLHPRTCSSRGALHPLVFKLLVGGSSTAAVLAIMWAVRPHLPRKPKVN